MNRTITIQPDGSMTYLDVTDFQGLESAGVATKRRASHVHPKGVAARVWFYALRLAFGEKGRMSDWTRSWRGPWMVDLALSGGPVIGPFHKRSDAIQAEEDWLEARAAPGLDEVLTPRE